MKYDWATRTRGTFMVARQSWLSPIRVVLRNRGLKASYFLPQVVSPIPEAQRLVPSEKVEQKKPARQSGSPEQVPHSSVVAHDDKAALRKSNGGNRGVADCGGAPMVL